MLVETDALEGSQKRNSHSDSLEKPSRSTQLHKYKDKDNLRFQPVSCLLTTIMAICSLWAAFALP